MTALSYPDDPEAIERLRDIMLERQAERRELTKESRFSPNPPPAECIARLLRLCFFASLWTEEGRQTRFSISYTTPEEGEFTCLFRKTKKLSARDVVKLAPALDMDETYIGVCEDPKRLWMWGLISVGSQDAPILSPSRREVDDFTIQVLGPGLLVVRFLGSSMMAFSKGQFKFVPKEIRLSGFLENMLSKSSVAPDPPTRHQGWSIAGIAHRMLRHGHGGTLLVVPVGDEKQWRGELLPGRHDFATSFTALRDCLHKWGAARGSVGKTEGPTVDYFQRYTETINAIARFTAVDGATIIRSDLTVPSFGAFVCGSDHGSEAMGDVVFEDLFEGGKARRGALREVGASRHQSAARFCLKVPGALGLVGSQDGSMCLMARPREQDALHIWSGIEFLVP